MKIALGTAQFGLNYGISNYHGKVATTEIKAILDLAYACNISYLDTAVGYGNSENRIGDYHYNNPHVNFNIITKISVASTDEIAIKSMINNLLERLSCKKIYALLLHDASELTPEIYEILLKQKEKANINKIGLSVYDPEQAFDLVKKYPIDIIQIPLNIFDQRFINSGCLNYLKKKKIEVHSRSIFLQGLLLQPLNEINSYFNPYLPLLKQFKQHCVLHDLSPLDLSLSMIHIAEQVDKFVIGVCSKNQLMEIISSIDKTSGITSDVSHLLSTDESLINPSRWRLDKS